MILISTAQSSFTTAATRINRISEPTEPTPIPYKMNQRPFLIKCPIESRHENLSLRSISSPRQQTTFFTPASSRFELKTSRSSYAALTYPYQSREIVTKCHNCSYKCYNQETGRWSMILKDQLERKDDLSSKPVHLDQEQFSRHQIFQETRSTTGKTFLLLFFFALFPDGLGKLGSSGTLIPIDSIMSIFFSFV